jgi:hypothetical protein
MPEDVTKELCSKLPGKPSDNRGLYLQSRFTLRVICKHLSFISVSEHPVAFTIKRTVTCNNFIISITAVITSIIGISATTRNIETITTIYTADVD